ncbi:hypothetical protein TNIN_244481 [Trichonephila inaurata madagascariensis]|uniref:Uncharacterized protein n=1 Tax=Trichonephila inaurata madagascariensis TaxID=2747483 RepID=A0A8X7BPB3_9ARAC|nr:hypothetical protein TNIN_244481 [Trichonephila inaurata madagascariensis]
MVKERAKGTDGKRLCLKMSRGLGSRFADEHEEAAKHDVNYLIHFPDSETAYRSSTLPSNSALRPLVLCLRGGEPPFKNKGSSLH